MLRRIDPILYSDVAPCSEPRVRIRYLGTAGFTLESSQRTLVLDPYVSRPGLLATGFSRLRPDEERIRRYIPRADDVLIGHAHHDHILDAPALCRMTGARLIGSPSACNVGRAAGLPESQLVETRGEGEPIACGPVTVRGLRSRHGKVYFGRVPLPGTIEPSVRWPARFFELRHGQVLNWHIQMEGLEIFHVDSADFIPEALEGIRADVACVCAIGWSGRPGYVEELLEALKPRYVLPCHWDLFFSPIEAHPWVLPGCDLPGFISAIRRCGAEPITLPILGEWEV